MLKFVIQAFHNWAVRPRNNRLLKQFLIQNGKGPAITDVDKLNSPLKKASLTGFHATAKHIAAKAVSPSSETMRTI